MVSEIVIVVILILLNGLFSMSEMSVVSARKSRLQQKADEGDKNAAKALTLAENPNRFLSTVQIGITLIGILSGAFGGATIAKKIGEDLSTIPWIAPYSQGVGVAIVVILVTYFSLVLGELVPKRIALNNPERLAISLSPFMTTLSKVTTPLEVLLGGSTNFILRILGIRPSTEPEVTEEDVKLMLDQGTENGVFEENEQDMVERIFRLGDRTVSSLMTPRMDIIFLDLHATHEEILHTITSHPFSRFPVYQDTVDNVIGLVQARDLLLQRVTNSIFDLQKVLVHPLFIPESTAAMKVLEQFKATGVELAIVIDEYGGVLGLVSMNDILEAIVGEVSYPQDQEDAEAIQREDGSWLFDGLIQIDDLKDYLDIEKFPDEEDSNYETLSGLIMAALGRLPVAGDHFDLEGFRYEVMDMDGRRVDKVLVSPVKKENTLS